MTSTTESFSAMLNEYLPNKLLKEELIKRDWLFLNAEKDNDWLGGDYIVPFEGGKASSIAFGSLTDSSDIAEYKYVRGSISEQPEAWGSLIFNHKDLMRHGKVSEQNFLQILPGQIEDFLVTMKETFSVNMLGAPNFASVTKAGTADGYLEVDHVERFTIGQKVILHDETGPVSQATYYVTAIDLNGGTEDASNGKIRVATARGGTTYTGVNSYTATAKIYHDGILIADTLTNGFTSLKSSLLSSANGGSASLYGVTKTLYPYLQAKNINGSGVSATNILEKLFDGYTEVRSVGRGMANKILMSYKHLGSCMKAIETQKGAYKVSVNSTKASMFGWTEIEITSVKGTLTIVGIQEMDNDVIMYLDMSAIKIASNNLLQKRKSPEGNEFYEVRATTGYKYIVDVGFMGDLILLAPSKCGIMHSIPNY